LGLSAFKDNYIIYDMTHAQEADGYLQVLWAKQNSTIEKIDEGNATDDSSKVIPTDDDTIDYLVEEIMSIIRFDPDEEDKIRIGIIAGAVISACVVVTIIACICKKRRDGKNSRAFSDFFADDSGQLKHRIQ